MAIVKLAMGLWTMSCHREAACYCARKQVPDADRVSAVYYAMLCVSRFSIVKSHTRTRQIADRAKPVRR